MIDVQKQVAYWRNSASEDWQVAHELIRIGRTRHGLFFVQLALEKLLKAHVCLRKQDLAPRIHNLVRLAEIAGLEITSHQMDILAEISAYNLEGRYPDMALPLPTQSDALTSLSQAKEVLSWLMSQLP